MTRLKKIPKYDGGTGPALSNPAVPTGDGSFDLTKLRDWLGLTPINRGSDAPARPSPTDLYNSIAPTIGAINNALSGFTEAAGATAQQQTAANADQQARIALLQQLGYSASQAAYLVATNLDQGILGLDLLKGVQGFGGSGGRTQFASEAALQEAQARLAAAQASGEDLQNSIIGSGSRLTMGPNGLLIDKLTGNTVDPSSVGLAREDFNFKSGPQFQENIRQFDTSNDTSRRGQDIQSQLGNLNAKISEQRNAADAAIGFGNLGVARTDQIRQILSNPSDALARLYMQRGGASPVDQIKMADLLGAFNSQMQGIDNSYKSRLNATVQPAVGAPDNIFYNRPTPETSATVQPPVSAYDPGASGGPIYHGSPSDAERAALEEFARQGAIANGHASGGYTNDKLFLGNEKGSELFYNPTGAPLAIMPHDMTKHMVGEDGKVKGYDEGTPSAGRREGTRLTPTPTGGFWNSLRETLSGLGNTLADASIRGNSRLQADMTAHPTAFMMGHGPSDAAASEAMGMAKNQGEAMLAKIESMLGDGGALDKLWVKAFNSEDNVKALDNYWKTFDRIYQIKGYLEHKLGKSADRTGLDYRGGSSKLLADPMKTFDPNTIADNGLYDTSITQVPLSLPKHADGTLYDYNTRLQGLKSFGSPYRGFNFQNYSQANGLDSSGNKIPELQYGYQPPSTAQNYSKYGPDAFRTVEQIRAQNTPTVGVNYNNAAQEEITKLAEQALAPGARSALEGTPQTPLQIPGLATPTPESLANLTTAEKQNLNTYLAAKFNSTFEDLLNQVQQRYSAPATRKSRLML